MSDKLITLTGSCGDGKTILDNLNKFKFKLSSTDKLSEDKILYSFDVSFYGKEGYFTIIKDKNGNIDEMSTLDIKFKKTLGIYNDPSLLHLAKKILERESKN